MFDRTRSSTAIVLRALPSLPESVVCAHRLVRGGLGVLLGAAGLALTLPAAPAPAMPAAPSCFGERATIVDLREGATVTGTPGRDVIVVRADANVNAGGRNDLICGHGDLRGAAGDDRISMRGHPNGELNFVQAFGGPGDDEIHRDEPRTSDPHFFIHSYGGPGDDELFGGPNPDVLVGGPGNDHVLGHGLNGVLVGGPGIDNFVGGP